MPVTRGKAELTRVEKLSSLQSHVVKLLLLKLVLQKVFD